MAARPWQGDLFKQAPPLQGRLVLRPLNSARRSREEARSIAGSLLPFAMIFIFIALGFVWIRIRYTEIAYRQATLREVEVRLENEHRELITAVAATESQTELERAGRKLGMVAPALDSQRPLR